MGRNTIPNNINILRGTETSSPTNSSAGFAAAFAKIGAVLTAFFFPILLASIGTQALLWGLIVTSLLGAAVTWAFRIETTGVSLDTFDKQSSDEPAGAAVRPAAQPS